MQNSRRPADMQNISESFFTFFETEHSLPHNRFINALANVKTEENQQKNVQAAESGIINLLIGQ